MMPTLIKKKMQHIFSSIHINQDSNEKFDTSRHVFSIANSSLEFAYFSIDCKEHLVFPCAEDFEEEYPTLFEIGVFELLITYRLPVFLWRERD